MSNPLADLRGQHAARRRRDLAARHAADAAGRFLAAHPDQAALNRSHAELAGAVDEWEAARDRCPPGSHYTLRLGRLIVTMGQQNADAPLVDDASLRTYTVDDDGNRELLIGNGYAFRLGHTGRAVIAGVVDWTPSSLAWSTTWRRARRNRSRLARLVDWPAAGDNSAGMSPGSVDDFAAMAAGHPRNTAGRDPRQPDNPWPVDVSDLR